MPLCRAGGRRPRDVAVCPVWACIMTAPPLTPCACPGPRNGEPHCACTMVRLGLPRSPAHEAETRAAARDLQRLFEAAYVRPPLARP